MAQDSINQIVQVIQPSNCKCDSVQHIINIPESVNTTNCCDVINTAIICVSCLLLFFFILRCLNKATIAEKNRLLASSELKKANEELNKKTQELESDLKKEKEEKAEIKAKLEEAEKTKEKFDELKKKVKNIESQYETTEKRLKELEELQKKTAEAETKK